MGEKRRIRFFAYSQNNGGEERKKERKKEDEILTSFRSVQNDGRRVNLQFSIFNFH